MRNTPGQGIITGHGRRNTRRTIVQWIGFYHTTQGRFRAIFNTRNYVSKGNAPNGLFVKLPVKLPRLFGLLEKGAQCQTHSNKEQESEKERQWEYQHGKAAVLWDTITYAADGGRSPKCNGSTVNSFGGTTHQPIRLSQILASQSVLYFHVFVFFRCSKATIPLLTLFIIPEK